MGVEIAPGKSGGVLECVERTAALAAIVIVPIAGVRALKRNHAGAVLARGASGNVGQAPDVAVSATIGKMLRHPGFCGRAQAGDDRVEIVAAMVHGRSDVVEVDHAPDSQQRRA